MESRSAPYATRLVRHLPRLDNPVGQIAPGPTRAASRSNPEPVPRLSYTSRAIPQDGRVSGVLAPAADGSMDSGHRPVLCGVIPRWLRLPAPVEPTHFTW